MEIIDEAILVFQKEIQALENTKDNLDDTFSHIVQKISCCKGKVIITGMGKSGHIGEKIAATMASLGTQAFFMHPAEALHGDLGMVSVDDVVIAISWSGESDEIIRLLPIIKIIGACIIGITGNIESTLAKYSDIIQRLPRVEEADGLNLAPTSSTTCELVYGDALAVVLSKLYGFSSEDFGRNHPAGSLGKKLHYRVADIMLTGSRCAAISDDALLKDAIIEMSRKALTIVSMVDSNYRLKGVITDGDLRRLLENSRDVYSIYVNEVMTKLPTYCYAEDLAVNALNTMKKHRYSAMPVLDKDSVLVGTITIQDIISSGIIG